MNRVNPMLGDTVDVVPTGEEWVLEPKLDGWRMIAYKDGEGVVTLRTRTGKKNEAVPYLNKMLEMWPTVLPNTILDGEVIFMGENAQTISPEAWNKTQSILSRNEAHVPNTENAPLTFVVFDVLELDGKDVRVLPLKDRHELLKKVVPPASPFAYIQAISQEKSTQAAMERIVEEGYEGVMCKRSESRYAEGRSPQWVKCKPIHTIEGLVVGTTTSTEGKYRNGVGAIRFAYVDEDGNPQQGLCSGFNDALRTELAEKPEDFIGKVIEVSHWGINNSGSLRFPQFKRFRDAADKAPKETGVKPLREVSKKAPREAKKPPVEKEVNPNEPSKRNYGAMADAKLLKCKKELEHNGDAARRAGACVPADLLKVNGIARERGL